MVGVRSDMAGWKRSVVQWSALDLAAFVVGGNDLPRAGRGVVAEPIASVGILQGVHYVPQVPGGLRRETLG